MGRRGTKLQSIAGTADFYRKMIEEIEDYSIIVLDADGYILNWNKGAEKIKGYSEEEILGKHFSIFYLPEDIRENLPQRLLERARRKGRSCHEGWRKRKDGSRFWGSITITAIHDFDNEVIGFSKVTRDLTDKKIAEDRLKMSEERYHRMVAEVQDYAIILLDVNGIVQNWNAGAEKIKGYRAEEIVGRSFENFYTPEDKADKLPQTLLNKARKEGKAIHEGWRVRKDGTKFWGTIVITALHGKDGQVIGFSKVTRDLTQQKMAQDQLNAYTKELEMQNKELEQFAYVASHDLQEPLRKIRTFADLIQENIGNRDFVSRYFIKLESSAQRMSLLIKSLLDYSRLSRVNSQTGQHFAEVNLNKVLNDVRQDFELLIEERGAMIYSNELPTIKGKYMQMSQLFSNLISNSIKFSQNTPVINISADVVTNVEVPDLPAANKSKNYHRIIFEDNGIGFEQQYDKIIFSLFQRLHGRHEYAGTGIGLALCKKIVENHGGQIVAESKPGKGASFIVYLPAEHNQSVDQQSLKS